MKIQQRLIRLEAQTPQPKPLVVWLDPGESQEAARKKVVSQDNQEVTFVSWLPSDSRLCHPPDEVPLKQN